LFAKVSDSVGAYSDFFRLGTNGRLPWKVPRRQADREFPAPPHYQTKNKTQSKFQESNFIHFHFPFLIFGFLWGKVYSRRHMGRKDGGNTVALKLGSAWLQLESLDSQFRKKEA